MEQALKESDEVEGKKKKQPQHKITSIQSNQPLRHLGKLHESLQPIKIVYNPVKIKK